MLRMMKGYDEHGTILLPPRNPSDKLPTEILEYYEEQKKKLEEEEKARREAAAAQLAAQQAAEGMYDYRSAPQSKNAVCATIRHSRYFH